MLVDSGAKVSVLNVATFRTIGASQHYVSTDAKLHGYGNAVIPVLGVVHLSISYKDKRVHAARFYITEKGENILGLDLFESLGFNISCDSIPVSRINKYSLVEEIKLRFGTLFEGIGYAKGYSHAS